MRGAEIYLCCILWGVCSPRCCHNIWSSIFSCCCLKQKLKHRRIKAFWFIPIAGVIKCNLLKRKCFSAQTLLLFICTERGRERFYRNSRFVYTENLVKCRRCRISTAKNMKSPTIFIIFSEIHTLCDNNKFKYLIVTVTEFSINFWCNDFRIFQPVFSQNLFVQHIVHHLNGSILFVNGELPTGNYFNIFHFDESKAVV